MALIILLNACQNNEIGTENSDIVYVDSSLHVKAKLKTDSSTEVGFLSKRYEYVLLIQPYQDSARLSRKWILELKKGVDVFTQFYDNMSYQRTYYKYKNSDRYLERVNQWDDDAQQYFTVSQKFGNGRVTYWDDKIFEIFVPKDSILEGEDCKVRVLQNEYGGQSSFKLLRTEDNTCLFEEEEAKEYFTFSLERDEKYIGMQEYDGILKRYYVYDPPEQGLVDGWIMDTISFQIFWH